MAVIRMNSREKRGMEPHVACSGCPICDVYERFKRQWVGLLRSAATEGLKVGEPSPLEAGPDCPS